MTWSYRPGDWFGIFGANAVVVLPPSEKARVGPVWALVDDGAGFDETLDALISAGLRDLPGFVLVSREGDETRVVLRGEAHAHFGTADDVVHVDGEQATTWVERTISGVERVRVEVAEETAADDLRVPGGLVRIAVAEWGSAPQADPAPLGPPPSGPPPSGPPPVEPPPSGPPPAGPPPSGPPPIEPPPVGPPVEPPATEALALPGTDHDGLTRGGAPLPERPLPGIPGQPLAPPVTSRPVARLVFSSGETVDVDRLVVVGRAPHVPSTEPAPEPGAEPRLVTVPSPHQEVSSTHLEVRPGWGADHGAAVVTDLGSTNGTLIVQPGLPPEDLRPGVAVQLVPGSVIDLGDGVSIQVVTP